MRLTPGSVVLFLTILLGWCPVALGQEDILGQPGTRGPGVTPAVLDVRWQLLLQAEAGSTAEREAIDAFHRTADELAYRNLPDHANVMLQRAVEAQREGRSRDAARYLDVAGRLSPALADVPFVRAHAALDAEPWNVPAIAQHVRSGWERAFGTISGRTDTGRQWRIALLHAATLLSMLLALGLLARHLTCFGHDLRLLSLRTMTVNQGRVLGFLLAAAPGLLLWSPATFVVIAIVVAALYMSIGERVVALLLLAGLYVLPDVADGAARRSFVDDRLLTRWSEAIDSPCSPGCQSALEADMDAGSDPAALARAWVHYRMAVTDELSRAEKVLDGRTWQKPWLSSALTLRGHLALHRRQNADAAGHYEKALEAAVSPEQAAAALYGVFRASERLGNREDAQAALADATRLDRTYVDRLIEYRGNDTVAGALPISPIPAGFLADTLIARVPEAQARAEADAILRTWYGLLPYDLGPLFVAFAGLALVAGFAIQRADVASRACRQCATPSSRFIIPEAHRAGLCVMCYSLQYHGSSVSFEQRKVREQRIEDWQDGAFRRAAIGNLLVPGLGLLHLGHALLGAVLMTGSAVAVIAILSSDRVITASTIGTGDLVDGRFVGGIAAWVVLLAVSLLLAAIVTRREEA